MTPAVYGFRKKHATRMLAAGLFVAAWTASAAPVIRSGAEPDYPPLSFVNASGAADGFSVELLRAALAAIGRDVSFETAPWAALKQKLTEGKLDVLPLVGRTPEREALYDFTVPYLTLHGALFVREDETAIQSLADLPGKTIAVMKGDNAEEYVLRASLSSQVVSTVTFEEAFRMLSRGDADAVIAQKLMGVTLLKTLGITNIRVTGQPNQEFRQPFCFAVQKENSALLSVLNEGLALTVQDGTQQQLKQKWLGTPFYEAALARPLIYGGNRAFPPFEYLDENGRPAGFNIDLARALARELGVEISFRLEPWSEIRRKIDAGEIDLSAMFYSKDRDRTADFSAPLAVSALAVFAGSNSPSYSGLDSLRGKRISVQNGDLMHDYLLKNGFSGELAVTQTPQEALRMLADGEVDFSASALLQGRYWIDKNKWNHLRAVEKDLFVTDYCFAVPQGNPALLGRVNEELTLLKESGEYGKIYDQWLGVLDTGVRWEKLRRILLTAGGALALTVIAVLWFVHLLHRQVRKKTTELRAANRKLGEARNEALDRMLEAVQAKENLSRSEENLRITLNSIGDAVISTDVDGRVVSMNPIAESLTGWTDAGAAGKPLAEVFCIINEQTRQTVESPVKKVLRCGIIVGLANHALLIAKDGKETPIADSGAPIKNSAGETTGVVLVFRDQTQERNARKALIASESKYRELFEKSADAFLIIRNGRFSDCNQAALDMLRFENKERLLNAHPADLSPEVQPDGRPSVEKAEEMMALARERKNLRFEWDHKRADGTVFPAEVSLTAISESENAQIIHTVWRDITERKLMQETIEKRINSLTRPPDNDPRPVEFDDLFNKDEIQRIQDEFSAATGVTSAIFLPDGTEATEVSCNSRLWRHIIRTTPRGCADCAKSDKALAKSFNPSGPVVMRCFGAGLRIGCVNIMLGDRHIANWHLGQVRDETRTEEQALQYAREIGADEQAFLEAFRELPVMSGEHFRHVAQALHTLTRQLSTTAYLNLRQARLIADEKRRSAELQRLSTAIEQSPEAVAITGPDAVIQYVNPAFETITGYSREEAVGKTPRILKSGEHDKSFYSNLWKTIQAGKIWKGRFVNKRKNGERYTEEASISPVRDASGIITGYVAVKRDISEELNREEQFRQSQKMEAVGQLAGGIAHDFNNILQAILGFSEILLTRLETDSAERRNAAEIQKAANRAAELIRQLLAFSRKQPVERKRIDLNTELRDVEALLQIMLGKNVSYRLELAGDLNPVYADHSQLTQIIMNLAVNARDAMPNGGRLTLATENITFEPHAIATLPEAEPGSFVCLSVTDTGCGMSTEVKNHLFEPFFTTKAVGQGTGLGLAVVYGIVKQNKGWIHVYSEEGLGSAFKIYLPACETAVETRKPGTVAHNGRILLVEDDADMRNLVIRILETAGYESVSVSNAEDALRQFDLGNGRFDLLFSDIVLPHQSGVDLADRLRVKKPSLRVLLYSGYQDQRERWETLDTKGYHFLKKPFSVTGLLSAVHDATTEINR